MNGPPEDKELELTEHLRELRERLIRISIVLVIATSIVFYFSGSLINSFWTSIFGTQRIYVFSPLEWIITQLVFSLILSLVILYPYIIYELYLFAKPGLYEHERKFVKIILVPSYFIFLLGLFVSYKFIVPFLYRIAYVNIADPYFSAQKTMQNAFKLFLAFGIFSQIPLATVLAVRLRLVTYQTLKNFRIPVYIISFLVITNVSMDFTGITQITALTMFIIMYELGLILARFMNKKYIGE